MSAGGKDLSTQGLDEIAKGLTLALDELRELGMVGEAGAGRGFGDLALSGLDLGHEGLAGSFSSFCERWEWGVRSLINEGNAFAAKTGLAAGTYYETDQYVEGTMKVAVNAVRGNPYASEDEITRQSWGEILSDNAYRDADYSEESFDKAWDNSVQGWKDASRDVMTSHTIGPLNPADTHEYFGISDAEYDRMIDDASGPSPEERARQQGGDAG